MLKYINGVILYLLDDTYTYINDGIKYTSRVARQSTILFQREQSRSLEMAKSYVSINFNDSDNMFDL